MVSTPTVSKETGGDINNPNGTFNLEDDTLQGTQKAPASSGITTAEVTNDKADNKEAHPEETNDPRSSLKERNNRYILSALTAMATGFFVSATLGWGPMQLMVRTFGS